MDQVEIVADSCHAELIILLKEAIAED